MEQTEQLEPARKESSASNVSVEVSPRPTFTFGSWRSKKGSSARRRRKRKGSKESNAADEEEEEEEEDFDDEALVRNLSNETRVTKQSSTASEARSALSFLKQSPFLHVKSYFTKLKKSSLGCVTSGEAWRAQLDDFFLLIPLKLPDP